MWFFLLYSNCYYIFWSKKATDCLTKTTDSSEFKGFESQRHKRRKKCWKSLKFHCHVSFLSCVCWIIDASVRLLTGVCHRSWRLWSQEPRHHTQIWIPVLTTAIKGCAAPSGSSSNIKVLSAAASHWLHRTYRHTVVMWPRLGGAWWLVLRVVAGHFIVTLTADTLHMLRTVVCLDVKKE